MSWPALKWMLMKRLPAPQKSTGITLARRQPDDLRPFADAAATLADESGLSLSGFKLAVGGLEEKGLLVIIRRNNRPNLYDLQLSSATHDVTTHDVTTHEVTTHEVMGHQSRRDYSTSHDVTTNKHKKQTPKDKHLPPRSREKQTDPRFQEFVAELADYWRAMNPGIPFDLTGKDGSQLKALLKDRASLTRTLFRTCLINRSKSDDVNHAKAPCFWLSKVTDYASEPLNKFGQPKGSSNGKGNGTHARESTAERNQRIAKQGIADNLTELFGQGFGGPDGADGSVLPSSGDYGRNVEGVVGEMGGTDADLWSGDFRGVTLQGRP